MYSFQRFDRFNSWSNAELQVHRVIQFTSASNPHQNMINFPCTMYSLFRYYFLFCSKSVLHPIGIWHWSNARDFFHLIFAHRASRLLDELCNDVSNRIHTVVIIQKERDSPGLNIKNFSNEADPSFNYFTKLACPSKLRWKIEDWIFIQVNFDRLYNLKVFRANV